MNDSTDPDRSGNRFDDPTAPAWVSADQAPPTQPVPTEPPVVPPSPYAAPQVPPVPDPYDQNLYARNPYGQATYEQQQQPYGQGGYQQQQPYDPSAYAPAASQSPYAPSPYGSPFPAQPQPGQNTGAMALTITSAIASALCCLLCVPALIFGIVALSKQSTDPAGSARMTRYGWVALGTTVAIGILLVVAFFALGVAGAFDGSSSYDYEGL